LPGISRIVIFEAFVPAENSDNAGRNVLKRMVETCLLPVNTRNMRIADLHRKIVSSVLLGLIAVLLSPAQGAQNYTDYTFVTLAGMPEMGAGSRDGVGAVAQMSHPSGLSADGNGNLYVADTLNHTIRKVTPAGVVTTVAGLAGHPGNADGTGIAARFFEPQDLVADGAGNLYVVDSSNHTIRKITPAGVVTTFAGMSGKPGRNDGIGKTAQFNHPSSIAMDMDGNLYVADTDNQTIRKITPGAVVTTVAGSPGSFGSLDGTGSAARFFNPQGVTVDGAGNIYVSDTSNNTIRKITPAGVVTTVSITLPVLLLMPTATLSWQMCETTFSAKSRRQAR
jgi:sugar lactone lactonase YvrE